MVLVLRPILGNLHILKTRGLFPWGEVALVVFLDILGPWTDPAVNGADRTIMGIEWEYHGGYHE